MKTRNFFLMLIALAIIAGDRLTKLYASGCNFLFCIERTMNTGAAFGILKDYNAIIAIISFVILIALFYFFFREKSRLLKISIMFLIAGTIGNLIDRILYGAVIDIIAPNFLNFNHFNIADTSNTIGAVLLAIFLLKGRK